MFAAASSHELCCFTLFVMGSAESVQSMDFFKGALTVVQSGFMLEFVIMLSDVGGYFHQTVRI